MWRGLCAILVGVVVAAAMLYLIGREQLQPSGEFTHLVGPYHFRTEQGWPFVCFHRLGGVAAGGTRITGYQWMPVAVAANAGVALLVAGLAGYATFRLIGGWPRRVRLLHLLAVTSAMGLALAAWRGCDRVDFPSSVGGLDMNLNLVIGTNRMKPVLLAGMASVVYLLSLASWQAARRYRAGPGSAG